MRVKVLRNIFGANEALAVANRKLLKEHQIFTLNLMSSPGAGKTSLILQTIAKLRHKLKIAVIEGDITSKLDAEKVKKEGVPVIQINTGGGCSLDANMISQALSKLPLEEIDLLFIENVGNLVCPAQFVLGEDRRVVISSIPEGDDKPYKYPVIFTQADAVVINKIDLLTHLEFDIVAFTQAVTGINPKVKIFKLSCKTAEGIEDWLSWLIAEKGEL